MYQARRRTPGFLIHQKGGEIRQTHFPSVHQAMALGRAPKDPEILASSQRQPGFGGWHCLFWL